MQLLRVVELAEVGNKELWAGKGFLQWLEMCFLGHLHLCDDTSANIFGEGGCVSNAKGVWAEYFDLAGLTAVEFCHAVDLENEE